VTYNFDHPLAVAIRERMARLGLNNEVLGEAVDVSHATISRWKRGHVMPGRDQIIDLEAALQFEPGELTLLAGYTPAGLPKVERGEGTLTLIFDLNGAKPGYISRGARPRVSGQVAGPLKISGSEADTLTAALPAA
jgi:transcriptional regulator with XRE-family HTH domain